MNTHSFIIKSLQQNRVIFAQLLFSPHPDLITWSQEPNKWSLLQIACHLRDEEREDFRTRLRYVLETPDLAPPPVNPVAWVTERNYLGQDFGVVTNVAESEVTLKELVEDLNGDWVERTSKLLLQERQEANR